MIRRRVFRFTERPTLELPAVRFPLEGDDNLLCLDAAFSIVNLRHQ